MHMPESEKKKVPVSYAKKKVKYNKPSMVYLLYTKLHYF